MSALLLDTHVWVWWISRPGRLSRRQRTTIDRTLKRSDASLLLSIISCWEVALLCQHGRLRFTIPADAWLEQAAGAPGIQVIPLSLPIIATAARLTALRDPADMLIVATAQHHGAQLVTSDTRIDDADVVAVVS
ncbi:MAG: type II toxin-antitoxin system VapC family toxin [Deltaproteobacteria bacterium]|nr:type II toxin-antitoxin system VapC family toxin [Deltaproteobacteria bacterium]MBI3390729.1 type II toxin-antitoxin system VapC family toxin [Deltaproteobacteria bacterium]